jgi:UDP-2,3-diacylglucosamine pyrophosphatase LpxH
MGTVKVSNRLTLSLHGKNTLFFHGGIFDFSMRYAHFLLNLGSVGFSLLLTFSEVRKSLLRKIGKVHTPFLGLDKNVYYRDLNQISRFEKKVAKMAIEHHYDHVVCGYSHFPKKEVMETRKGDCLYLNSGDWVKHMTALEYSFKRWKLYQYENDKLASFYMDEELKGMDMNELIANLTHTKAKESQNDRKRKIREN